MAHPKVLCAYPADLGDIDKDKLAECIAALVLNVYKLRGMTRHGWRMQRRGTH